MARKYNKKIALIKNGRGIYSLDTVMGCEGGMRDNEKGCYGDCYAASYAKRYGYDFSRYVRRDFESHSHFADIYHAINRVDMPFIRIGTSGDPSEDWRHTFDILEKLKDCKKEFVIITRHWKVISDSDLLRLADLNVCINTSVSALDSESVRENCLLQYERLKPYCKSVLRIVTCDFNTMNPVGFEKALIQDRLIDIDKNYIDTVFRPSKSNPLVKGLVINVEKIKFLGSGVLASKANKKTYFGKCGTCPEMCGADDRIYKPKQFKLFKRRESC